MRSLSIVYRLGLKELISLRHDKVLIVLIVYAFTIAIYLPATSSGLELRNASVAIVDEDGSYLSRRIADAFLAPYFQPPRRLAINQIDAAMDAGRYTFVLDIPPNFQSDILAGRRPDLQLNIDATAVSQAGIGAGYIKKILADELIDFVEGRRANPALAVETSVRVLFNPNLDSRRFVGVMQIINMITMLAIVLSGAALVREREHGTIDHLLVMPLSPFQIMAAKIWANGLVIVAAATLSLILVIGGLLQVPITGSIPLYLAGTVLYLFSANAIGIFLATVARTMPQLGLLFIPIMIPMIVLSGGFTPLDSMPEAVQLIMQISPTTHFVEFATAVLFRAAGIEHVWNSILAMAGIGLVFFVSALLRFRSTVATMRG
jgi:ABC-2 type transport system permease protein